MNAIARHGFDPSQKHFFPVAQLVELTGLRAQYAPKMMRSLTLNRRAVFGELPNKESPAHARILTQCGRSLQPRGGPRGSLLLAEIDFF